MSPGDPVKLADAIRSLLGSTHELDRLAARRTLTLRKRLQRSSSRPQAPGLSRGIDRQARGCDCAAVTVGMRSPFRTSERHSPRCVSSVDERMIDVRHRFAYELVENYATENARLLDIGSGEGYGATIAGRYVAEYVGVDVSQTAVDAAQGRYGGQNVSFGAIRDNTFPSEADRFDLLISFQVIEHVDDVSQYLSEIRRVAVDGATLLITTPNRTLRLRSRRTSVESSPRPRIRRGRAPRRARDLLGR